MATPILTMEFVMGEGSGVEVSLLQMEERIMGKRNNECSTTSLRSIPKCYFLSGLHTEQACYLFQLF